MKKNLISISALIFITLFPSWAIAHTISYSGYKTNSNSTVIYGSSLDWMKWDATKGMSIEAALQAYEADGWRVANLTEIEQLFGDFNIPNRSAPWPFSDYENFISMFGVSIKSSTHRPVDDVAPDGTVVHYGYREGGTISTAQFAGNGIAKVELLWGIYNTPDGETRISNEIPIARIEQGGYLRDFSGVALVRTVLEPSSAFLILLAIPALIMARRRKHAITTR